MNIRSPQWSNANTFLKQASVNFYSKPMRPKLFFLSIFVYYKHKLIHFVAWKVFLKYYFYRKNPNLKKNYTKMCQISHIHSRFQSSLTPRKKTKFKKIFTVSNSTLDELCNDTTPISLRWIYQSAKIYWTKKPIWVYSSSPKSGVRTKNSTDINANFFLVTIKLAEKAKIERKQECAAWKGKVACMGSKWSD